MYIEIKHYNRMCWTKCYFIDCLRMTVEAILSNIIKNKKKQLEHMRNLTRGTFPT